MARSILDQLIPISEANAAEDTQDTNTTQSVSDKFVYTEEQISKGVGEFLKSQRADEDPSFIDRMSQAVRKGHQGAMLGWDFLANKLEKFVTGDTKNTEAILNKAAKEYAILESDPQVIEAMNIGSKAYEEGGGGVSGGAQGLKTMLGYFIDNPSAAAIFVGEQLPGFLYTAPAAGAPGALLRPVTQKLGLSAAKQAAVNTAVTGATVNSLGVVGNALGPNYSEGLIKFDGDVEKAKEYAVTKTAAEVPANAIAGLFLGIKPTARFFPGAPKAAKVVGDVGAQAVIQGTGGGVGAYQAAEAVDEDISFGELGLEILGETFTTPVDLATELAFRPANEKASDVIDEKAAASDYRDRRPTEEEDILWLETFAREPSPNEQEEAQEDIPAADTQVAEEDVEGVTSKGRRVVYPPSSGPIRRKIIYPPTGRRAEPTGEGTQVEMFPETFYDKDGNYIGDRRTTEQNVDQLELGFEDVQAPLFDSEGTYIGLFDAQGNFRDNALPALPNTDQLQLDFSRPLTDQLARSIIDNTLVLHDTYSPQVVEDIYDRAQELIDQNVPVNKAFEQARQEVTSAVYQNVSAEQQTELPLVRRGRPVTKPRKPKSLARITGARKQVESYTPQYKVEEGQREEAAEYVGPSRATSTEGQATLDLKQVPPARKRVFPPAYKPETKDTTQAVQEDLFAGIETETETETTDKRQRKVVYPPSARSMRRVVYPPSGAIPNVAGFRTAQGSIYRIQPDGKTARTKFSSGEGQGKNYPPSPALYLDPNSLFAIQTEGANVGKENAAIRLGYSKKGRFKAVKDISEIPLYDKDGNRDKSIKPKVGLFNRTTNKLVKSYNASLTPEVGLHPVEKDYNEDGTSVTHIGNPISEIFNKTTQNKQPASVSVKESKKVIEDVAETKRNLENTDIVNDQDAFFDYIDKLLNSNKQVSETTEDILGDTTVLSANVLKPLLFMPTTFTVGEFARRRGLGPYVDKINNIMAKAGEYSAKLRYRSEQIATQMSAFMFDNPKAAEVLTDLISLAGEYRVDPTKHNGNITEALKNDKTLLGFKQERKNPKTNADRKDELNELIKNRESSIREIYKLWNDLGTYKRRPSIFFPQGVFKRRTTPEGHEIFTKLRDTYRKVLEDMKRVDLANIDKLKVPDNVKATLKDIANEKFAELEEVEFYSPQMRFGKRFVRVRDGDEVGLYTFGREIVKKLMPGVRDNRQKFIDQVAANLKASGDPRTFEEMLAEGAIEIGDDINALRNVASKEDAAISKILTLLNEAEKLGSSTDTAIIESLRDSMTQLYVDNLPSVDLRKRLLRRKNVAGYDKDPLRAFSNYMQHASNQIARREFSKDIALATEEAREQFKGRRDTEVLDAYIDELHERASIALTPEPVPETLRAVENLGANAVFYTALSGAASSIQNTFTIPIMGLAIYGNKYGYAKTMGVFAKYMGLLGAGKNLLPEDFDPRIIGMDEDPESIPLVLSFMNSPFIKNDPIRRKALELAINRELVQQNFSSELTSTANLASSERLQGRLRSAIPRAKLATEATLKTISYPFKATERIVREGFFLGAFDMEFSAALPRALERARVEGRDRASAVDEAFNEAMTGATNALNEAAFNYTRHNRAFNRLMAKGELAGGLSRNATRLQSYVIQHYDFVIRNTLIAFGAGGKFEGAEKGQRRRDALSKLLVSMGMQAFMGGIRALPWFGPTMLLIGAALDTDDEIKKLVEESDGKDLDTRKLNVIYKNSYQQYFTQHALPEFLSPEKTWVKNVTAEINKFRDKDKQLTPIQVSNFLRLSILRGVPGAATDIDISPQVDTNVGNFFSNPYEKEGGKFIDLKNLGGVTYEKGTKFVDAIGNAIQNLAVEGDFRKAMDRLSQSLGDLVAFTRNIQKGKQISEKGVVSREGKVLTPAEEVSELRKKATYAGYGSTKEREDLINFLGNQRVLEKVVVKRNDLLADLQEDIDDAYIYRVDTDEDGADKPRRGLTSLDRNLKRVEEFNKDVFNIEGLAITDEMISNRIEKAIDDRLSATGQVYMPSTRGLSKSLRTILENTYLEYDRKTRETWR